MKAFLCAVALLCATIAEDDDSVDYAQLLQEYEAKTGSAWRCDVWPSGKCACHEPSNCKTYDYCSDCGCGNNYCYCSECEDGFELRDSECGTVPDECVAAETVSAAESVDEHEDIAANQARNLPEWNGEDIIGATDWVSSYHKLWKTENYEPLAHSFAYDTINCGDLEVCEVNCNGERVCYQTTINGESADKVVLNCVGDMACDDLHLYTTGGEVEINCVGAGSCYSTNFYTSGSDVSISCDNGPETDSSYKHGACHYMEHNVGGMMDMPEFVSRGGSLNLECVGSTDGRGSCEEVQASCPDGTDSCTVNCNENGCWGMQLFLGNVDNDEFGTGGDNVHLTCANEASSCKNAYISCVDEEQECEGCYFPSSTFEYKVPDGANLATAKQWSCNDDSCCPSGLATGQ